MTCRSSSISNPVAGAGIEGTPVTERASTAAGRRCRRCGLVRPKDRRECECRAKTCEVCGATYRPLEPRRHSQRFCSTSCRARAQLVGPNMLRCEHCAQSFSAPRYQRRRKYCSTICAKAHRKEMK